MAAFIPYVSGSRTSSAGSRVCSSVGARRGGWSHCWSVASSTPLPNPSVGLSYQICSEYDVACRVVVGWSASILTGTRGRRILVGSVGCGNAILGPGIRKMGKMGT